MGLADTASKVASGLQSAASAVSKAASSAVSAGVNAGVKAVKDAAATVVQRAEHSRADAADQRRAAVDHASANPNDAQARVAAAQAIAAELQLAQATLTPSMAERYEQDMAAEFRGRPEAQQLLTQVQAFSEQAPPAAATDPFGPPDPAVMAQLAQWVQSGAGTPPQPLSEQAFDELVDEVLDAGHRGQTPIALAESMTGLTPSDQARLVAEVLSQTSGVTVTQMNHLHEDGVITSEQYQAVADGVVAAGNRGLLSPDDAAGFLQLGAGASLETAERAADFLNHVNPAQRETFVSNFARAGLGAAAEGFGGDPFVAARAESMLLLMHRTVDQQAIAEVYAGFDAEARQNILSTLGGSDRAFHGGGESTATDGLAILIEAVASQQGRAQVGPAIWAGNQPIYSGPDYGQLAVEIARYAETSDDSVFYNGSTPRDVRAEALGRLMAAHGEPILDAFTDHALASGDGGRVEDQVDKIQLANMLRLTAMNPENSHADAAMAQVEAYVDTLGATANTEGGDIHLSHEAESRLEALVRAQVLVPAQIYADGVETGEASAGVYQFAVNRVAQGLDYLAGKIPVPGVDWLAEQAVEGAANLVNAEIDDTRWAGLDPFLAGLDAQLAAFEGLNGTLGGFGILDDVQLEISDIAQRLQRKADDELLHSNTFTSDR
jgi:hypothetical protein